MIQNWLDELFPEPDYHYISNGYYSWLRSSADYPMQLNFLVYCGKKMLFAIDINNDDVLKKKSMKYIGVPLINIDSRITKDDFIDILYNNSISIPCDIGMVV